MPDRATLLLPVGPTNAEWGSGPAADMWETGAFDRAYVDGQHHDAEYLHVQYAGEDAGWNGSSHRLHARIRPRRGWLGPINQRTYTMRLGPRVFDVRSQRLERSETRYGWSWAIELEERDRG